MLPYYGKPAYSELVLEVMGKGMPAMYGQINLIYGRYKP